MDENDFAMRSRQVLSAPGVGNDLLMRAPAEADGMLLVWLPAMGVPARHYQPLASALASHGLGVALHEWRGIGSSSVRAGRHDDWGYRELLTQDLPALLEACRRQHPRARLVLGGHSLGGQLACLFAGLQPEDVQGLVLVGSGTPYWRGFRPWGLPLRVMFSLIPWAARLRGHFPGRKLGFGGNEARGVVTDWAHSGRTGRYGARGMAQDLEHALRRQQQPLLALRLGEDRLGPEASLRHLLRKMPHAPSETQVLDDAAIGAPADHFAWMKTPQAVAERIAAWGRRLD
jgi:predicted alpha/beta hydrolase